MENRIKENQLDCSAIAPPATLVLPNARRLLLSLASRYTLIAECENGTGVIALLRCRAGVNAYVGTIRLKLFKIGAVMPEKYAPYPFPFGQRLVLTRNSLLAANRSQEAG